MANNPQAKCHKCGAYKAADEFLTPFMVDQYCRVCAKAMTYKEIKELKLPYNEKR